MVTMLSRVVGACCLLQLLVSNTFVKANNPLREETDYFMMPPKYITLDISDVIAGWGYHYITLPFGSGYELLVAPIEPYRFERIVHEDLKIYICDVDAGSRISGVAVLRNDEHVLISVGVDDTNLRFAILDGSVVRLTPKEYLYRAKQIASSETLDINQDESSDQVQAYITESPDRTIADFRANIDFKIDKVVDGVTTIWEYKNDGEYSADVQVTFVGKGRFVKIVVEDETHTEDIYYIGMDGVYKNVSFNDFFTCMVTEEGAIEKLMSDSQSEI